jgi:hypothetical protein
LHSQPPSADGAAGDWAPRVLYLFAPLDCNEDEAQIALGSQSGTIYQ